MKQLFLSLALAASLVGCGDPSGGEGRPDKPLSIKLFGFRPDKRTITISVPELNPTNAATLMTALSPYPNGMPRLEGFIDATPHFDTKTLDVEYDALKLGIKNIEFAIASAGFAAGDTPAYPLGKP